MRDLRQHLRIPHYNYSEYTYILSFEEIILRMIYSVGELSSCDQLLEPMIAIGLQLTMNVMRGATFGLIWLAFNPMCIAAFHT